MKKYLIMLLTSLINTSDEKGLNSLTIPSDICRFQDPFAPTNNGEDFLTSGVTNTSSEEENSLTNDKEVVQLRKTIYKEEIEQILKELKESNESENIFVFLQIQAKLDDLLKKLKELNLTKEQMNIAIRFQLFPKLNEKLNLTEEQLKELNLTKEQMNIINRILI